MIEHNNITPFRLIFPGIGVHAISFSRECDATDLELEMRSSGLAPCRFQMGRGAQNMTLVRNNHGWEGRTL